MKVKQLLYGMMYGLLIFFTASCSEENSENLPDNIAIYQSYLVAFSDSQPTLTYARFSPEKDVPLKEIKLTGGASIMANGKEMEYHYLMEIQYSVIPIHWHSEKTNKSHSYSNANGSKKPVC